MVIVILTQWSSLLFNQVTHNELSGSF